MNVFRKVTLESLKKNRTRTTVTIVGIMLSTALMTAMTTSVSSFQHFMVENEIASAGSYHDSFEYLELPDYQMLAANEEVAEITYLEPIGYAMAGSSNAYKPYLYIAGMGSHFSDLVSLQLVEGRMPENPQEILLPEHLSLNGAVYYHVGDTLTLEIGDRMMEGYVLTQNNPYTPADELGKDDVPETFVPRETRTYTVVGICSRPNLEDYSAPGYTCFTVDANGTPDAENLSAWLTLRHPNRVYEFNSTVQLGGNPHTDLLMYNGISSWDGFTGVLYGLAAILTVLIVFGSVALIYNAFAISVSERTKQFGLLSSIGATKKQIRYMVRFEATCVAAVGIPLGILLGLGGIAVTFLCLRRSFTMMAYGDVPMTLYPSWIALAVSLAISLVTVRISAWVPSRRAMKVTAVEAIRQSRDIRAERRPIRTPKWIYKLFGLPGMLGQKYFKRSRRKYRTTILSLFMSVVLFISAVSFSDNLRRSVSGVFDKCGYDLTFCDYEDRTSDLSDEDIRQLIENDPYVEKCAAAFRSSTFGTYPQGILSPDAAKAEYMIFGDGQTGGETDAYLSMEFLDDTTFREYLREKQLSEAEYMNPAAPKAICLDRVITRDEERGKYIEFNCITSDTVEFHAEMTRDVAGCYLDHQTDDGKTYVFVSYETGEEMLFSKEELTVYRTLTAGTVIHERPYFLDGNGYVTFLYPMSAYEAVAGDVYRDGKNTVNYMIVAEEHAAAFKSLRKTLTENLLPADFLYDIAKEYESERSLILIINVFSFGFIVLISLIAAANVFNSISTNINLRRREFAMLRSIGMTGKGLIRMMNFECILYGAKSLLYGLPVSFVMSVLVFMAIHNGFETDYRPPIAATGFAVFAVFAVVFSSMLYAMRKIRSDNPMDTLKNENL